MTTGDSNNLQIGTSADRLSKLVWFHSGKTQNNHNNPCLCVCTSYRAFMPYARSRAGSHVEIRRLELELFASFDGIVGL